MPTPAIGGWLNTALGVAMWFGRYLPIVFVLAPSSRPTNLRQVIEQLAAATGVLFGISALANPLAAQGR